MQFTIEDFRAGMKISYNPFENSDLCEGTIHVVDKIIKILVVRDYKGSLYFVQPDYVKAVLSTPNKDNPNYAYKQLVRESTAKIVK